MNTALLQKVRAAIADEDNYFNQLRWWINGSDDPAGDTEIEIIIDDEGEWCGTPCCIAGHAVHEAGIESVRDTEESTVSHAAEDLLGLDGGEALKMFDCQPVIDSEGRWLAPTREEALEMLDHAIEHKEVVWPTRNASD